MQNSFPATETIHAAHNLSIEHNSRVWRLYNGTRADGDPNTRVALIDANANQILCEPTFAHHRDLAHTALSPSDVARVVVGWAPESRSWHLGLLLAAQPDTPLQARLSLAQYYRSRWPDCLTVLLLLGHWLLDSGQDDAGVKLLHAAAGRDIAGQVACRLWGRKTPTGLCGRNRFELRWMWPCRPHWRLTWA